MVEEVLSSPWKRFLLLGAKKRKIVKGISQTLTSTVATSCIFLPKRRKKTPAGLQGRENNKKHFSFVSQKNTSVLHSQTRRLCFFRVVRLGKTHLPPYRSSSSPFIFSLFPFYIFSFASFTSFKLPFCVPKTSGTESKLKSIK